MASSAPTGGNRTAYTYDARFLLHDPGVDEIRLPSGEVLDPEPRPPTPRNLRRTAQLVANSGLLNDVVVLPARPAGDEDLELFHTSGYVAAVHRLSAAGGGTLEGGAPIGRGTWDAAVLAAGSAIALTDAVIDGIVGRALGLLRPPGHQAGPDRSRGSSVFNNPVLAVQHARRRRGLRRVAIVDWDVHHGTGIQEAFWSDPDVLFIGLHQDNWSAAGQGAAGAIGGQGAAGTTVNVPLPPGTGDLGYLRVVERVVAPIVRQFRPELLVVSHGADISLRDPRGRMLVTTDGFRRMATAMRDLADEVAHGRLLVLEEESFSAAYAPFCSLAVLEAVVGVGTDVGDPLEGDSDLAQARVELRPGVDDAIAATRAAQAGHWDL